MLGLLTAASCSGELAMSSGAGAYTLSVKPPVGGTISTPDGSLSCPGTCELTLLPGTQLQLTATPQAGAFFESWSEGCADTLNPICAVTIDRNLTVSARFSSCSDSVRNGRETGLDCGGPACGPCAVGGGCVGDEDCAMGLRCANSTCTSTCSASSITILGTRSPTITPETVVAGGTATTRCRYPTYQFLSDSTIVQDFSINNSNKAEQTITCKSDGSWSAPNGEKFNTLNCIGIAPCNGCALPGTQTGAGTARDL